ncbi:hypothetical protein F511_34863 [Dorcoceras hygrometricum]|uniref:AP2/ERF domain-containing protein n=1 Tax=Dorcoceras hygrometricum TaxID=472368 RepID=A0A2Z7B4Z8_9LAMI|nr:hypothetical protein F511_34863 [Dorcoceras hygrometricum]
MRGKFFIGNPLIVLDRGLCNTDAQEDMKPIYEQQLQERRQEQKKGDKLIYKSQSFPGGYDMEEMAIRAYDLAALKYWGLQLENYRQEFEDMKNMSREEYVAHLRWRSCGFSRGASIYRGVTRHHQYGWWLARIGRVARDKDLYIGTFSGSYQLAVPLAAGFKYLNPRAQMSLECHFFAAWDLTRKVLGNGSVLLFMVFSFPKTIAVCRSVLERS